MSIESVLRCAILKQHRQLSYEELSFTLIDSLLCQTFARLTDGFVPKYRYRILKGDIGKFIHQSIYAYTERSGCEMVELNVQPDHVHLLVNPSS
jgi:transposase IS200 family protein